MPSGHNLSRMHLHTKFEKFEVPGFTYTKNMMGVSKFTNGLRNPDHAHLRVVCHPRLTLHIPYLAFSALTLLVG